MLIILNPGHFVGTDPGASSADGVTEAVVVRTVGKQLQALLEASGQECRWVESDSLAEITEAANAAGADLFISLHANAADSPAAHGCEVFYCFGSEAGEALSSSIQASLVRNLLLADRGFKAAGFYVLRYTAMPAVLCELAFLSNPREAALLDDPAWQQVAAGALFDGVMDYLCAS